jgi:hypothetical protein
LILTATQEKPTGKLRTAWPQTFPVLALSRHAAMSDLRPFSGAKGKSHLGYIRAAYDPNATLAVQCGSGFDAGYSPIKAII